MVSPRDLVSIDVRLDPVLDLRYQRLRRTLRMSPKDLRGDSPSDLEACRRVADWARAEGHVALLAPSAPDRSGTVLAIYPDMQPASGIEISLGPDRLPLNHSGSQLLS